jgi:uncharacterized circularly permuted ATP-grasp superfamily protein
LKLTKRAIYTEAEEWQKDENLWNLHQYVTGKTALLEKLLRNVYNSIIPEELIPPQTKEAEGEVINPDGDKPQIALTESGD